MNPTLITYIHSGSCTLIVNQQTIHMFKGRGIDDLYHLYQHSPDMLYQSQIADKIVGKAAAAIMILASVSEVYAEVISEAAANLLAKAGIPVSYGVKVPHIINRHGTGLCPLEIRCHDCNSPQDCLAQIQAFLRNKSSV